MTSTGGGSRLRLTFLRCDLHVIASASEAIQRVFRGWVASSLSLLATTWGAQPSQHPIGFLHLLRIEIDVAAHLLELGTHLRHALLAVVQRRRVVPHVLRDFHR